MAAQEAVYVTLLKVRIPGNWFIQSLRPGSRRYLLAGEVIRGFDYPGALPGGVVIHGGVSQLSGISRIAENILQMPVRIGRLQNPGPDLSPTFANALGLVKYRFSRLQGDRKLGNRWEQNKGFVGKIFNWFEDRTRR